MGCCCLLPPIGGLYGAGIFRDLEVYLLTAPVAKHWLLQASCMFAAVLLSDTLDRKSIVSAMWGGFVQEDGLLLKSSPKLEELENTEKGDDSSGDDCLLETWVVLASPQELASQISNVRFEKRLPEFAELGILLKPKAFSPCPKSFGCCCWICSVLKQPNSPKWLPHISYKFESAFPTPHTLSGIVCFVVWLLSCRRTSSSHWVERECLTLLAPGARHNGAFVETAGKFKLLLPEAIWSTNRFFPISEHPAP